MSDIPENQEEMALEFHTDIPVGEILRRTRRHYGQSLFQIEQVLRIRASQLEALENGDIHLLPGRVYAIGFVRSYSEYLGLDGDKMVHLFKEQSVGKQKKPEMSFSLPASESKIPDIKIIGASLAGVLVLIGFISYLMFPERDLNEIPSVPDSLTKSQLNEAPALVGQTGPVDAVTPQDEDGTKSAGGMVTTKNRIQLEITDASWIEVKNKDGVALLRQVLKPGDIYMVPNEPGLVMATGNAGGIQLKVDGKDMGPVGALAAVRRNIKLDADEILKAGSAAKRP
jgi:cytoskeleton protein RodZ